MELFSLSYPIVIGQFCVESNTVCLIPVTGGVPSSKTWGEEPECLERAGSWLDNSLERFFTSWGTGKGKEDGRVRKKRDGGIGEWDLTWSSSKGEEECRVRKKGDGEIGVWDLSW